MVKKENINKKRRTGLKKAGSLLAGVAALTAIPALTGLANAFENKKNKETASLSPDAQGNVVIPGKKTIIEGSVAVGTKNTKGYTLYVNGTISAAKGVFNSVWGDMADFRPLASGQKAVAGKAYVATEAGLIVSRKRAQKGSAGICSDTYGFALGGEKKDKSKAPLAVAGWVLAYVDKKYSVGTALVAGKNGVLTKARLGDKLFRAERILGVVETSPKSYNKLDINGRYWVRVK